MPRPGPGWHLLTGKTFPHREQLRRLGGQWDEEARGWWLPSATYDKALTILRNCEGQLSLMEEG